MLFSTPMLDAQSGDAPESLGARLKALREAKGLTLDDVAEATNIPPERIEAIESDTLIGTAPAAYARGFVRIYAEHLEADVDKILEEFDRLCRPERARLYLRGLGQMAHTDYRPSRRRGQRHTVAFAILLTVVVLLALALAAYVYVHFNDWLGIGRSRGPAAQDTSPHASTPTEPRQTPEGVAETPVADEPRFVLAVFADRNAAIKAEVDGSVVDNFVLAKGRLMDWKGHTSVRLELQDPSAVRLYKDGEPITDALGTGPVTIVYDEEGFRVSPQEGQ
jgi:cytoskeletal protein RodZ